MACRVHSWLFRKKISSLIVRFSDNNEREKRAYEEQSDKPKSESAVSKKINECIQKYPFGSFTYTYYNFLEKFHVEPKTWRDIFEYIEYSKTDTDIKECLANAQPKQ